MTRRSGFRRVLAAAVAVGLTLAVAACAPEPSPLLEEYQEGQTVEAGGSQFELIDEADRGEPVEFVGELDTGGTVSSEDYAGQVLVVNFWYAECAPCRLEAPILQQVHEEFHQQGAAFLGVNTLDQADASIAFAETFGVSYPSALAASDPALKLAFAEHAPLSATPITLVLDTEGRVAARIVGPVPTASILRSIVSDLVDQP